jgi:hypothetical protein
MVWKWYRHGRLRRCYGADSVSNEYSFFKERAKPKTFHRRDTEVAEKIIPLPQAVFLLTAHCFPYHLPISGSDKMDQAFSQPMKKKSPRAE